MREPPRAPAAPLWRGFELVTTRETRAAFALLGHEPGRARASTLARAATSAELCAAPLSEAQARALLAVVGADGRGVVSLEHFDEALGVRPPPAVAPRRTRLQRAAQVVRRRGRESRIDSDTELSSFA